MITVNRRSHQLLSQAEEADSRPLQLLVHLRGCRGRGSTSSIVNEGIRAILNLFILFYFIFLQKDFTRTKSTKRIQANKNKKDSIFMRIKNI